MKRNKSPGKCDVPFCDRPCWYRRRRGARLCPTHRLMESASPGCTRAGEVVMKPWGRGAGKRGIAGREAALDRIASKSWYDSL